MHQRRGLLLNRTGQMRVAMTQRVHRDAGRKVEIALAAFTDQVATFSAHRPHVAPGIDGHQRSDRHSKSLLETNRIDKIANDKWRPIWAAIRIRL